MDWKEAIENPRAYAIVQEEYNDLDRIIRGMPLPIVLSAFGKVHIQRLELLRREMMAAWKIDRAEADKRRLEEAKQKESSPPLHPTEEEVEEAISAMERMIPGLTDGFENHNTHGWIDFESNDYAIGLTDGVFYPTYVSFHFDDQGRVSINDDCGGIEGRFDTVTLAVEAYARHIREIAAKTLALVGEAADKEG